MQVLKEEVLSFNWPICIETVYIWKTVKITFLYRNRVCVEKSIESVEENQFLIWLRVWARKFSVKKMGVPQFAGVKVTKILCVALQNLPYFTRTSPFWSNFVESLREKSWHYYCTNFPKSRNFSRNLHEGIEFWQLQKFFLEEKVRQFFTLWVKNEGNFCNTNCLK